MTNRQWMSMIRKLEREAEKLLRAYSKEVDKNERLRARLRKAKRRRR